MLWSMVYHIKITVIMFWRTYGYQYIEDLRHDVYVEA